MTSSSQWAVVIGAIVGQVVAVFGSANTPYFFAVWGLSVMLMLLICAVIMSSSSVVAAINSLKEGSSGGRS